MSFLGNGRALLLAGAVVALSGCGNTVERASGGAGGTGGTGSTSSKATSGTTMTSGTNGTSVGTGPTAASSGTGAACVPDCANGLSCCDGKCVNLQNDPHNCGVCGTTCTGATFLCEGTCVTPECTVDCGGAECCGNMCCANGTICCDVQMGGPTFGPQCTMPVDGTCPVGCPLCQG